MSKTTQRRNLRFESLDAAIEEAESLLQLEQQGKLTHVGQWTLGQALGHLATWANFPFDGYPPEVHAPWFIRMILRAMRGAILKKGMMAGVRVGKVPGGTLGTEVIPADEGLRRVKAAFARLQATAPAVSNPAFGKLTHEEWIQLNIRHAELHLSFQIPKV
jgi:hypothetical protein